MAQPKSDSKLPGWSRIVPGDALENLMESYLTARRKTAADKKGRSKAKAAFEASDELYKASVADQQRLLEELQRAQKEDPT